MPRSFTAKPVLLHGNRFCNEADKCVAISDTKRVYENLYRNMRTALYTKVKAVELMEREIAWLKRESGRLEGACVDMSDQRERREREVKELLGTTLGLDMDEVGGRGREGEGEEGRERGRERGREGRGWSKEIKGERGHSHKMRFL